MVELIKQAAKACPQPLVCDEVEYHPYLDQTKVRQARAANGLALVAYSPIARGKTKNDQTLVRIGRAYRKSSAQICLRWLVHQNASAIPRTSRMERLSENIDIFDFELSPEKMDQIAGLATQKGRPTDFGSRRNGIEAIPRAAMLAGGRGFRPVERLRWKFGTTYDLT